MKIHFVWISLIVVSIILSSNARVSAYRNRESRAPARKQMSSLTNYRQNEVNSRGVGSAMESAAGFVGNKVKQVVTLIKCVLKCLIMNTLNLKICSQMFPCLYDCFIGQEYIPPDVQSEIDKVERGSAIWPRAITFDAIFNILKCIYKCGTERPIRNWETFVYTLYCFADSCVCLQIFGAG